MPEKVPSPPPPRGARKPGEVVALAATMLVAALALNAPAMLRSAEKLPFDAPSRAFALRALSPAVRLSAALRLDRLRAAAEAAERRWLEPPAPVLPAAPDVPGDDEEDDDDLDEFLDLSSAGADEEKCCQCDNVANCQFQFPMEKKEEETEMATGNIGTGNIFTLATFPRFQSQFPMKGAS